MKQFFSAGLDYKPGYFARRDEVIAVMQAATPWRANFPNHDRLTPESNFSSVAGIEETIEIGEKTNVMPVVTHIKVQGREQGDSAKVIAMMRAASARGRETVSDIYPYLAGQTGLGAVFIPAWAMDGGRAERRAACAGFVRCFSSKFPGRVTSGDCRSLRFCVRPSDAARRRERVGFFAFATLVC